jgi:hypothetical protein
MLMSERDGCRAGLNIEVFQETWFPETALKIPNKLLSHRSFQAKSTDRPTEKRSILSVTARGM